MNSEAICDEIEWLIQRNPFADNLPADITINDLLDKLEAVVTTPEARAKLKEVRSILDGAYKGADGSPTAGPSLRPDEALSLVRRHLSAMQEFISKSS